MKKYEKDLLIGTSITLVGIILLVVIRINIFASWGVIIFGKILVILSVMEYADYRRAFKGEDLSKDNRIRKTIRQVRKKYRT